MNVRPISGQILDMLPYEQIALEAPRESLRNYPRRSAILASLHLDVDSHVWKSSRNAFFHSDQSFDGYMSQSSSSQSIQTTASLLRFLTLPSRFVVVCPTQARLREQLPLLH